MHSTLLIMLCFVSLGSYGLSLDLPTKDNSTSGANPLPPPPPRPPVGPDNYPIPGTELTLRVHRPYGEALPYNPTILCLVSAQSALDRQIAAIGDQEFPLEWTFQEGGIRIIVLSYHREDMYLSTASIALRGLVRVMNLYAELGTKAVNTMIYESEVISGRIEISRSGSSIDGIAPSISTGTLFQSVSKKALDPTNYRVPNTTVTVSLEGMAPYGSPLPKNPLILALTFASAAADQVIQTLGDHALPGLWRCEEGEIGIDVYTQLSIDCNFSILEKGLMGLVDLITEPGGVGAVAAEFNFKEDGKGEVASGRLKLLKTHGPSTAGTKIPSASRIEQSRSTSVTLARDVAETGAVGTA